MVSVRRGKHGGQSTFCPVHCDVTVTEYSHCERRIRERLWVCLPITAVYLLLIFGGQWYMRERPAWDVRRALICWNWLCSIFSFVGALRVVPHALYADACFHTLNAY
jgi:hypothetical protein